ncbi:DUF6020 family protein [Eubacterium sp.]
MKNKKTHLLKYLIFGFLSSVSLNLSLQVVTNKAIEDEISMKNPNALFRLLWDFKRSLSGYNMQALVVVVALTLLFYTISKYMTKFVPCAAVTSALFTFFQIFGSSFKHTASWDFVFGSTRNVIKSIVSATGYGILFYFLICGVLLFFKRFSFIKEDSKVQSWFTNNRKSLFIVAGLILLMWLPYYIAAFPGLTNFDFFDMLDTFYGRNTNSLRIVIPIDPSVTLNNNNPVLQTLMAVGFIKFGNILGSPYIGLFLFIAIQAILFALVLSYTIRFLAKKNINKTLRIILLLMFGLIPVHANFAFTTLKDTNFAFTTLLYLLFLIDFVLDTEAFIAKKFNLVKLALLTLVMMFLRNNGLYVVAITAVVFLIAYRKYFKKIAIAFILPILLFEITTLVIYPALKISPGSSAEAYSIPFQQAARVLKEHGDEIPQEDQDKFRAVFFNKDIENRYDPEISDPVKSRFDKNTTPEQLSGFFSVWLKYLGKYPDVYVQATMNNCYGYFYPEAENWLVYPDIAKTGKPYGLESPKSLSRIRIQMGNLCYVFRRLPGLGMLESIGFYVWGIILVITAFVYFRDKKKILMLTPILVLLLTCIASPANTLIRYVYPAVLCAPVFIFIVGYNVNKNNNKEL